MLPNIVGCRSQKNGAYSATVIVFPMSPQDWTQIVASLLAIIFLLFWISLRLLHIMAVIYGKWRLHKKKKLVDTLGDKPVPGVSILKPLCSNDDPYLFSNLETYFTLDYPLYELLFCFQDSDNFEMQRYIQKLTEKYPNVDTKLFFGGEKVGVNPKINNMSPGYKSARYELILISDARIKMKPDTLDDMVACMTDKIGLVHQMPFSCDRSEVPGSMLEKIHFGTSFARMYLAANVLGINCAAGMSTLIRKDVLDAAGGLKAFSCYLAEDFFFAQAVQDAGLSLQISSQPAWQNSGEGGVVVLQNRLARWTKLRNAMLPHMMFMEPLSECLVLGLASAWAVLYLFRWDPMAFFFIHVLLWFIMDWILLLIIQNGSLPFNKFEFLVMWVFHEIQTPYLTFLAQTNPSIQWQTNHFRLRWGGVAELVHGTTRKTAELAASNSNS